MSEHPQIKEEFDERLVDALKKALQYDGTDRPALVARIPVICNDIRLIKERGDSIMNWIRASALTLVMAIVAVAVAWGSLSNQVKTNTQRISEFNLKQNADIESAVQKGVEQALKNMR